MPELSLVDEDYGQLNTAEDIYPVTFPAVLIPEMTRKRMFLVESVSMPLVSPRAKTISQIITNTTTVRIVVARLELIFATPTFAKIAVSAANRADSSA